MNSMNRQVDGLLRQLERLYGRREQDFGSEASVYRRLLPKLIKKLSVSYKIIEPVGLGSTASVWKLNDIALNQPRALKLTRPSKSRSADIVQIIRQEPIRLASLNHQNIIKVFTYNEVHLSYQNQPYIFPFFVMEFLAKRANLDDAVLAYRGSGGGPIIEYIKDALSGIDALHTQKPFQIVHCDIKPGNILVPPDRPALISDLGYAKHLSRTPRADTTKLITTHRYAHPDLLRYVIDASEPSATAVKIRKDKLQTRFDLFALGRTIQEILCKLRVAERNNPDRDFGRASVFNPYQWQYLSMISKRLLDGIVQRSPTDSLPVEYSSQLNTIAAQEEVRELFQDSIPDLPPKVMQEIRYQSAAQAIEDIEKLQHLYDLEGRVPELNPNARSFIQIPHCQVPLTDRVRAVINHAAFQRISQTTQLGFVSMVYPSARHTRYEHVLGTFWHCCEYVRALWYDQTNPFFQCIMTERDLAAVLLAALVHDISQFPMAHDLTEIHDRFAHENYLFGVLERAYATEHCLGDVVGPLWGVDIAELAGIVNSTSQSTFKQRLLRSILDGVLDCDKLDYVRRDSLHAGVSFGLVVDHARLFRNLTTIWGAPTENELRADEHHPGVAEIGVAEKAFVVAKSLMDARKDMFRQVYWQHTTRTLKAMLAFVVRGVLVNVKTAKSEESFWADVEKYIADPGRYYSPIGSFSVSPRGDSGDVKRGDVKRGPSMRRDLTSAAILNLLEEDEPSDFPVQLSNLDPSDDSLLTFLWRYSNGAQKSIITAIRSRKIFERIAVISHSRNPQAYEQLYEQFRQWRLAHDFSAIEEQRRRWEDEIKRRTIEELQRDGTLLPRDTRLIDIDTSLKEKQPLVLIDIPIRATSPKKKPKYLRFVREDPFTGHRFPNSSFPRFESFEIERDESAFDFEVGKIRLLADPQWREMLIWVLGERLRAILIGE